MSRTRRKFPPNLRREDYDDNGNFIVRGQYSVPKLLHPIVQIWHPKAKKFRKKFNARKQRRRNKNETEIARI